MKKKIVNVLLTAAVITTMMFSATACGSKADDAQNTAADAPVATQAAADADANANADAADTADTKAADADAADTADTNEADTADTDVANEADTDEQKDDAADGAMSLEEWTESDLWSQFMEEMGDGMEDQGASIFHEVDGDVLTLVFQYQEQLEVADGADSVIEEAIGVVFDAYNDTFEMLRDEIISETGNDNVVLRIEYRNADDSVLYSRDF